MLSETWVFDSLKKNLPRPTLSPVLWANGWEATNFNEQIHVVRDLGL